MSPPKGGFSCTKGCSGTRGGKVVRRFHPGKWDCPKEPEYNEFRSKVYRQQRERALARSNDQRWSMSPQPEGSASAGTSAASSGTSPSPASASPSSSSSSSTAPGSSGVRELVLAGGDIAATSRRSDEKGTGVLGEDIVLDEEHTVTVIQTVRAMTVQGANVIDGALDVPTKEWFTFEFNTFDENNIRSMFARRLVTRFLKALGCKTLKEMQETADSIGFIGMFGMLYLSLGVHAFKQWGPALKDKLAERKKKLDAKAAELKRQKAEAEANARGLPGPEPAP